MLLLDAVFRVFRFDGVHSNRFHDSCHVGLVLFVLFGTPKILVGGNSNGDEHFLDELSQAGISSALGLVTRGLPGSGIWCRRHGTNVGAAESVDKVECLRKPAIFIT